MIKNTAEEAWDDRMERFWDIPLEEDESKTEREICEEHFKENLKKLPNAYEVALPFVEGGREKIKDSISLSMPRYYNLMKSLDKDPWKKREYEKFLNEWKNLGFIEPTTFNKIRYLLPHHPVINKEKLTTKLRVVLDGGMKTRGGASLNQVLRTGPKLQQDLTEIIMKFRKGKIAVTADCQKMFNSVRVREEDSFFQCFVWKYPEDRRPRPYKLNTLVFGLNCSSFLAIRSLLQVAEDEENNFPIAAEIIRENFYIDDACMSFDSEEQAVEAIKQLNAALTKHNFHMRKYTSNRANVLKNLHKSSKLSENLIEIGEKQDFKTLGIFFDTTRDEFLFKLRAQRIKKPTKRSILSSIMTLYDLSGFVEPLKVTLKHLMQKIWLSEGIAWDDKIPKHLQKEWERFNDEIEMIQEIRISRWIQWEPSSQVFMFADATPTAFGSCAYVRTINREEINITLLISKSRLSPMKKPQSIPRLELCAILLMAELSEVIKRALKIGEDHFFYYSDSTPALSWIHMEEQKLNIFVANRVKKIREKIDIKKVFYVETKNNSADLLTRQIFPNQLMKEKKWLEGPQFLREKNINFPQHQFNTDLEIRKEKSVNVAFASTEKENIIMSMVKRISSWNKLRRVVAFILRIKNSLKGTLTLEEIHKAENKIFEYAQRAGFPKERESLAKGGQVTRGPLAQLTPYLDGTLMKIKGRLGNAPITDAMKHGVILPAYQVPKDPRKYDFESDLVKALILHFHLRTQHGGVSLVVSCIREKYWVLGLKSSAKYILRRCVICRRYNNKTSAQIMGQIPSSRLTPSRPFTHVSLDLFGPISIKAAFHRTNKTVKVYGLIIICHVSKATHIEICYSLSAESYVMAIKRFISKRGVPSSIFSDNGTNLVKGSSILKQMQNELIDFLKTSKVQQEILDFCSSHEIKFSFAPPRAPHTNGLAERYVGLTKSHLHKVLGERVYSLEYLQTVLCLIEGVLNSKPICQYETENKSYKALTPAQLLIGANTLLCPTISFESSPVSILKSLEVQAEDFWRVWKQQYLIELNKTSKWQKRVENVEVGQLVIIEDDCIPKGLWRTGEIVEVFPDYSGAIRKVKIKKSGKILTRHIEQLCILPVFSENSKTKETINLSQEDKKTLRRSPRLSKSKLSKMLRFTLTILSVFGFACAEIHPATAGGLVLTQGDKIYMKVGEIGLRYKTSVSFSEDISQLEAAHQAFKKQCELLEGKDLPDSGCRHMSESIKFRTKVISEKILDFKLAHSPKDEAVSILKREKRSGFVSSIWRFLFGGDSDTEVLEKRVKIVDKKLEMVEKNEESLVKLQEAIGHTEQILEKKVDKVWSIFNRLSQDEISFHLTISYLNNLQMLNFIETRYEKFQNFIFPQQEFAELENEIIQEIPPHLRLPPLEIGLQTDIIRIQPQTTKNGSLELLIHVPLVVNCEFQEFFVNALPNLTEKTILKTPKNNIVICDKQETFFYINREEGKRVDENTRMVENRVLLKSHSLQSDCIVNAIFNKNSQPDCAKSAIDPQTNVIIPVTKNWILYYSLKTFPASLICGSKRTPIQSQMGTIRVDENCQVTSDEYIIVGQYQQTFAHKKIKTFLIPHANLTDNWNQEIPVDSEKGSMPAILPAIIEKINDVPDLIRREKDHPLVWLLCVCVIIAIIFALQYIWQHRESVFYNLRNFFNRFRHNPPRPFTHSRFHFRPNSFEAQMFPAPPPNTPVTSNQPTASRSIPEASNNLTTTLELTPPRENGWPERLKEPTPKKSMSYEESLEILNNELVPAYEELNERNSVVSAKSDASEKERARILQEISKPLFDDTGKFGCSFQKRRKFYENKFIMGSKKFSTATIPPTDITFISDLSAKLHATAKPAQTYTNVFETYDIPKFRNKFMPNEEYVDMNQSAQRGMVDVHKKPQKLIDPEIGLRHVTKTGTMPALPRALRGRRALLKMHAMSAVFEEDRLKFPHGIYVKTPEV